MSTFGLKIAMTDSFQIKSNALLLVILDSRFSKIFADEVKYRSIIRLIILLNIIMSALRIKYNKLYIILYCIILHFHYCTYCGNIILIIIFITVGILKR